MTRRATDNTKALDAFIAAKTEIDAMLERLAALSADHFETSPDEIHWGHVGDAAGIEEALKRISELYAIEDEIRGLPESERLAVRQQRSKVLLTSLHEWMVEKNGTLSKKSRLGEAFSYVLNQWDALCYYSDDGLAEADNNAAERALRAVCLGKKNFMFFGSDHGGERGALLYGLIGTCRLNGIDPEAYLRHILSVLPEWPSNRVDELLPWNVVLTNK